MSFDHDKLVVYVNSMKGGREFHGDESQVACDVGILLHEGENRHAWEALMAQMLDVDNEPLELLERATRNVNALTFEGAAFDDHKVNFWAGNKKIASLMRAQLSKFKWARSKGVESLHFNVHSLVDGDTAGKIWPYLDEKVRLEVVTNNPELDLEQAADAGAAAQNGAGDE